MTSVGTLTLADFLLARIAEDEAVARAAAARNGATWATDDLSDGTRITGATEFGNPRSYRGDAELWDDEGAMGMFAETAAHVVRHAPARVLAECETRRRIIQWRDFEGGGFPRFFVDFMLRQFAAPYADHPDYRSEWAV